MADLHSSPGFGMPQPSSIAKITFLFKILIFLVKITYKITKNIMLGSAFILV
jgi:hypothetical protein